MDLAPMPASSGSSRAATAGRPASSYVDRNRPAALPAAEIVILAANGVGTPRLLLASGLANSSDQVGRNLLHHTLVACEMWVDEPLASHTGYVALISREFAETDVSRGFVNGFNFNCVTTGGAGEQANGFLSNARAPWGRDHHKWFARHFGRGFGVFGIGDDLPNPENRITLSDTERDEDGVPVARLLSRRERPADDALHARPAGRDRQGGRRLRVPAAGLYRREGCLSRRPGTCSAPAGWARARRCRS